MQVNGELRQWHKITLDFEGPSVKETASTFRDYRLDVTFVHAETGTKMTVPGYFAADGNAANSGATGGNAWRVHFNPPETGKWSWKASFRTGDDVAVSRDPLAGKSAGAMDGDAGSFTVASSNKGGDDLRAKGLLQHDGDGYLNFAGDGDVFLKSGVGSPENFLGYSGFDGTPGSHDYAPHAGAWRSGDPSWDGAKGKGIIGAVNYLAAHDVNSAYMLLMNVGGDGRDVYPWSASNNPSSFDVSKLAQWEVVFEHMQKKGITLHLFLQETENDQLLNNGNLGPERMLYMREMVARFGHHNGVIFNLGEENTNTTAQLEAHSAYLKALDAYGHPVALHTWQNQHSKYEAFEGSDTLDVLSFQGVDYAVPDLDRYLGGAKAAGRPVVAFLDESGTAAIGMAAEGDSGWQANHATLRETLWKFYAEGGSGAEWYFGYNTAGGRGGDLEVEDFSLRESAYGWSAAARRFFEDLPLERMSDGDGLTSGTTGTDQVLARKGEVYAIYLPDGGSATLDLSGVSGRFSVSWYDVVSGKYVDGSVTTVSGGGKVGLGQAPYSRGNDWAIRVERSDGVPPPAPEPEPTPAPEPEPTPAPDSGQVSFGLALAYDDGRLVDGSLTDGEVVALEDVSGGPVTLIATPSEGVGSVRMELVGISTRIESAAPYVLFGDAGGDYNPGKSLGAGDYEMILTAFSGQSGGGSILGRQSISFSVAADFAPEPEPNPSPGPEAGSEAGSGVVYRWNAGTKTVAATDGGPAWAADAGAVAGGAAVVTHPDPLEVSLPRTPAGLFAQEYYGKSKVSPMGLEFGDGKLASGTYAVRLFMGDGYAGTDGRGERVFDVKVENKLFLDNLDLSATLGHRVGGMFEWRGTVGDGTIDIDFVHGVQNPLINGVEIVRLDGAGAPPPPPQNLAPAAATAAAPLALVDAASDVFLFDLAPSVIIDADATEGVSLSAVADAGDDVDSIRFLVDGVQARVENDAPFALFGANGDDYAGGLRLADGDVVEIAAELFGAPDAGGARIGKVASTIRVEDGVFSGTSSADVFAFDVDEMGPVRILNFEEADGLALFGAPGITARSVLDRATVVNGDTVVDFGGLNVMTIEDYASLSADDLVL